MSLSVHRAHGGAAVRAMVHRSASPRNSGFAAELDKTLKQQQHLKFSSHAQARLKSRNIALSEKMITQLHTAVEGAAGKGARDSLVVLSDLAFIVNIPNRTVVTAMDSRSMENKIITNIDTTVIAR